MSTFEEHPKKISEYFSFSTECPINQNADLTAVSNPKFQNVVKIPRYYYYLFCIIYELPSLCQGYSCYFCTSFANVPYIMVLFYILFSIHLFHKYVLSVAEFQRIGYCYAVSSGFLTSQNPKLLVCHIKNNSRTTVSPMSEKP